LDTQKFDAAIAYYLQMMKELMKKEKHSFENSKTVVPEKAGVYAIYDKKGGAIIYVGRTKHLNTRLLRNHKRGNTKRSQFRRALKRDKSLESEDDITRYIEKNCVFQFMEIEDFEEQVRLEHFMTAISAPVLNVKLKQR